METTRLALTVTVLAAVTATIAPAAEERTVESRIVSVGLFKNGLAIVKREVPIGATGTYCVRDVPVPVHGTFWIESDAVVQTRLTTRMVDTPVSEDYGANLQADLAGLDVTVLFRDGKTPPVSGKVVRIGRARGESDWDRTYQRQQRPWGSHGEPRQSPATARFLILDTNEGRVFVDSGTIACLRTKQRADRVRRRLPVLLLNVTDMNETSATVFITYLTKGMAWAPSYLVDVSDPETLLLRQKAVLKNELGDISDTDIQLISGFPSVQFFHVTSPLSMRTTWSRFFSQLAQRVRPGRGAAGQMVTQQRVISNVSAPSSMPDMSAIPMGEGVDLHYQPIGKRTLEEGDSLALSIASGEAKYERIVEWIIPDTRDVNGRYIAEHRRRENSEKYEDDAWDAVRFKNPLDFPMTTAPAMITANGQFNGQQLSYWTNPGEATTLHVTKALSIRTRHVQHEEEGERKIVYIGGNDYREVNVTGQLTVNNHRKEAVTLVIRRRFSSLTTTIYSAS
ncbi:MAG: hypothetical protein R6U98_26780 [Pirellulaceae bacterium]